MFIAISLCLGIGMAYFYMREKLVWAIILMATFLISVLLYVFLFSKLKDWKKSVAFSLILIIVFGFGSIRLYNQINTFDRANLEGRLYQVTAKIVDKKDTDFGTKVILDKAYIEGIRIGKLKYKIALNVYGENKLDIGNTIKFSANLFDNSYVYEDIFNAYDIERGIKYSAGISSDKITIVSNNPNVFERCNLFLRNTLKQGLDENEFSVGYALLTGNSDFMDYELISSYRQAGVAHIFAVSGLHIGFLASILTLLLRKLKISGTIKAIIITLILLFYSGICGFSASSLRATTMSAMSLFAISKGQRYDGISAMSLSAILILIVSPIQLLCVGFQLSFVVVIGIILLAKPISKIFKFLPNKLALSIGAVLAAQIVAIPICLKAFGEFSLISIIVNLIFIPIVSFIFTLTLLTTIIGGIFSIAEIALFLSNYILMAVNFLIRAFDYDIFMIEGFVLGGAAITYYSTAIIASGFVNLNKLARRLTCIIMALICITSTIFINIRENNCTKIYVSHQDSISATLISKDDNNTLIVSNVEYIYSINKLSRINIGQDNVLDNVIIMGGYKIDMQVFITKLLSAFKIGKIYYYGEKQEKMDFICNKIFPEIALENYFDKQKLDIKEFSLQSTMDGCAMIVDIKDKHMAILSKLELVNPNINYLSGTFDIMICLDRADLILNNYMPKTAISYAYSPKYKNAQSNGNLIFKLY